MPTTSNRRFRSGSAVPDALPTSATAPTERRARHIGRWICLAVIVGAFLWASSIRVSSGPAAGTTYLGASEPAVGPADTFRVGIFNIHGGKGADGRRDLARTADCLRSLDFIGLNEVVGPKLWWQTDQCQQLGELLNHGWLFAPTESRWWDGSFGNGAISALPVKAWQRVPLPRAGAHTFRNVVLTRIEVQQRPVHVLLTHLDSRNTERRQEQLRIVGDLFLSLAPPAILLGDFNATADDAQLRCLLAAPGVIDAVAANPQAVSPGRIDWILARGLQCLTAGCEDAGASDHPLYWAEFKIAE